MDSIRINRQLTTCSLAIRLIDAYTGKSPLTSGLQIVIDHVVQQPIIKPDGYIIYTNVPSGEYTCRVKSHYYSPITIKLNVDNLEPIFSISLQPNVSYPFGMNATLVRLIVKDLDGNAVGGAQITAVCKDDLHAKAILAQEVESGTQDISLTQIKGKVIDGDFFLIANRGKSNQHDEYCCISKEIDGFRNFKLEQPLLTAYPRGAMFLSTVKVHTNATGEAVIPFRNPPSKLFLIQLTVSWKDFITVEEVEVKEAQSTYMDTVQLGETLI